MTNKQIRSHALSLYKKNFGLLLAVGAVLTIQTWMIQITDKIPVFLWRQLVGSVVWVMMYPLVLCATAFSFRWFHGERMPFKTVFQYYTNRRQLPGALLLGVCMRLIDAALMLVLLISPQTPTSYSYLQPRADLVALVVRAIAAIALWILAGLFLVRLFLVPYLFVQDPETNPLKILSESVRKTKRRLIELIVFRITLNWIPFLVVYVSGIAVWAANGIFVMNADDTVVRLINVIISLLFSPYVALGMSGMADRLLRGLQSNGQPYHSRKLRLVRYAGGPKKGGVFRYKVDWAELDDQSQ